MGGEWPGYNKNGKTWTKKGYLTRHINQLSRSSRTKYLMDCEIVLYEVPEPEQDSIIAISDFISDSDASKKKLEDARILAHEKFMKDERRRVYEALKKEFGKK